MRMMAMIVVVLLALVTGCGGDEEQDPARAADPSPSITATASASAPAELTPVIDGKFEVGSPKRELAITCWGSGKPAVVLDSGSASSGIDTFGSLSEEIIKPLAERSTVCTYDRAGTGSTAELPMKRRTIDDQAEELDALLAAAGVPKPRVLVGSSWGGFVAVQTARNHPDGISGIVLLDVPAGDARLTADEAPEAAWDHPANFERVDSFHAERTMARDKRSLSDVRVTVVTADAGQSDKRDQRVWTRLSRDSSQVVLSGAHDIYNYDAQGVVEQIVHTADGAD